MLKKYLSNKIRSLNRWLQHPEREDDTTSELSAEDQVARYENLRDEAIALQGLRDPAVVGLLRNGVRLHFPEMAITVGANFIAGDAKNEIFAEDADGQRKHRVVFSAAGIDTLIETIEADVLSALKREDASAVAAAA